MTTSGTVCQDIEVTANIKLPPPPPVVVAGKAASSAGATSARADLAESLAGPGESVYNFELGVYHENEMAKLNTSSPKETEHDMIGYSFLSLSLTI